MKSFDISIAVWGATLGFGFIACAPLAPESMRNEGAVSIRVAKLVDPANGATLTFSTDNCYALHITGPHPELEWARRVPIDAVCKTHPQRLGILTQLFSADQALDTVIPVGERRRIDVLAVPKSKLPANVAAACVGKLSAHFLNAATNQLPPPNPALVISDFDDVVVKLNDVALTQPYGFKIVATGETNIALGRNDVTLNLAVPGSTDGREYNCPGMGAGSDGTLVADVVPALHTINLANVNAGLSYSGVCNRPGEPVYVTGPTAGFTKTATCSTDSTFTVSWTAAETTAFPQNYDMSIAFAQKNEAGTMTTPATAMLSVDITAPTFDPIAFAANNPTDIVPGPYPVQLLRSVVSSDVVAYAAGVGASCPTATAQLWPASTPLLNIPVIFGGGTNQFWVRLVDRAGNTHCPNVVFTTSAQHLMPRYATAGWNVYYKRSDTSLVCTGSEPNAWDCIHAGERLSVSLKPSYARNCSEVLMEHVKDSRDAFNWVCVDRNNQAILESTGFKPDRGLQNILDFSGATTSFLPISLAVRSSRYPTSDYTADTFGYSPPWTAIFQNVSGTFPSTQLAGTIYVMKGAHTAAAPILITSDQVTIVTNPTGSVNATAGLTTLISASNRKHFWIEGTFHSADDVQPTKIIKLDQTTHSRLHRLHLQGGSRGVVLSSSSANQITDTRIVGIKGSASGSIALEIFASASNWIEDVRIASSIYGISILSTSTKNMLKDVRVSHMSQSGVTINFAPTENTLYRTIVTSTTAPAVTIDGNYSRVLASNIGHSTATGTVVTGSGNTFHSTLLTRGSPTLDIQNGSNNHFHNLAVIKGFTGTSIEFGGSLGATKFSGTLTLDQGASCIGATYPNAGVNVGCNAVPGSSSTLHSLAANVATASFRYLNPSIDDSQNPTDTGEDATDSAVNINWTMFDRSEGFERRQYRVWMKDATDWLQSTAPGSCAGGLCRVFDWRPVAGGGLFNHTSDSNGTNAPTTSATCAAHLGNDRVVISATSGGTTTHLKNAIELVSVHSPTGDNDGFCEAGETCLAINHHGAYQGSGKLKTCTPPSAAGGLANITMKYYENLE